MATVIPWHRRLEARALAGVAMVVGVSLAALALVTGEVVTSHTLTRSADDLSAAHAAFTHLVATRSELVAAQTRLITGLPVFRAYLTDSRLAHDRATVGAMADMYREDLHAAFTIVSDGDGRWLASAGLPSHKAGRAHAQQLVSAAAAGHAQRTIIAIDHVLYILVAEPATFADEVLGTLTTGYALDD